MAFEGRALEPGGQTILEALCRLEDEILQANTADRLRLNAIVTAEDIAVRQHQ